MAPKKRSDKSRQKAPTAEDWQRPAPLPAFPRRDGRDKIDEAAREAGLRSEGGAVRVVFNTPVGRHALPLPEPLQQTGKSLFDFLETAFPMYDIAGFAMMGLHEDPVEYRNGHDEWVEIPGTTKVFRVKMQQIVLRKAIPKRYTLDIDDGKRTLGDWGFDPSRHALQIYPERLRSSALLEHLGHAPTPASPAASQATDVALSASDKDPRGPRDVSEPEHQLHDATPAQGETLAVPYMAQERAEIQMFGSEKAESVRGPSQAEVLEMYSKRAQEVGSYMHLAAKYENIPLLRRSCRVAQDLLSAKLEDSSNAVQGSVRAALSSKRKRATKALEDFQRFTADELEAWRRRRQELRLQSVRDAFTEDQRGVIRKMFAKMHSKGEFKYYQTEYGPACGADYVWDSLDAILREDAAALESSGLGFMHLAMLIMIYQTPKAAFSHDVVPGWPLAVQAMGAALFAQFYPEDVAAGRSFAIESGLPVDLRRDDEQYLLHFFFEPTMAARVTLLADVRNWGGGLQARQVEPALQCFGLAPLRYFHVKQDVYEPSDIEVQSAAFLSFKILHFDDTLDWHRREARRLCRTPSDRELAKEWLEGQCSFSCENLLPNTDAMVDCIVQLAQRRQRLLLGRFNLGLRHEEFAYASACGQVRIADEERIQAILDVWGSKGTEGILPLTLDPPQSEMDWALEGFFWQCLEDHRDDLTVEEEAVVLLSCCSAADLEQAASDRPSLAPDLAWLRDPKLRQEQERRAESVRREWASLGETARRPWRRRPWRSPAGGAAPTRDRPEPEPTRDAPGRAVEAMEAIKALAQKRVKFRQAIRGVNVLIRLGILGAGNESLRVLTHGSHTVFHGPGGAATLVRQHDGTAPMPGTLFVHRMRSIMEVAAAP